MFSWFYRRRQGDLCRVQPDASKFSHTVHFGKKIAWQQISRLQHVSTSLWFCLGGVVRLDGGEYPWDRQVHLIGKHCRFLVQQSSTRCIDCRVVVILSWQDATGRLVASISNWFITISTRIVTFKSTDHLPQSELFPRCFRCAFREEEVMEWKERNSL